MRTTSSAAASPARQRGVLRSLPLPEAVWRERHRWVTTVLLLHVPVLATWTAVQGLLDPTSTTYLLLITALWALACGEGLTRGRLRVHRTLASCAAAAGLMACSSYLVSVSGGYIEAHFHFFVLVPVVALYEAWPPFLLAIGIVLVEHGIVGTLWPHHVYGTSHEHQHHPWRFAAVHAAFFAAACLGSFVTWRLAERARAVQAGLVDELRHLTRHDELTNLLNRTGLAEAMDEALASGTPVAVAVLDIDRFKEVNDTLGHGAGDELLRDVAARAQRALGTSGVLARLGGDEFAVLLPDADLQRALRATSRLQAATSLGTQLLGVPVTVQASAGVAVHHPLLDGALLTAAARASAAEGLLRQADIAMYRAKADGGGTSVYDPRTDVHTTERLSAIAELHTAVEADDQIVVHFQPKVSLVDGALHGVEALARWQHPSRGLLPPSEFVEIATGTDVSDRFTRRVLEASLRQCAAWAREGIRVPVAVNVPPRCLLRPGFVESVGELLAEHGVPPHLLAVEVTEDALVHDTDAASAVLDRLRRTGVAVAVDDFGTGFSSLSYLQRLPIDELKIDRSFVERLAPPDAGAPVDDVMVAAIIDLGHRLGLRVVAEGVETPAQQAALAALGCDLAQGYLHSRPVPADEVPVHLLATAAEWPSVPVHRPSHPTPAPAPTRAPRS